MRCHPRSRPEVRTAQGWQRAHAVRPYKDEGRSRQRPSPLQTMPEFHLPWKRKGRTTYAPFSSRAGGILASHGIKMKLPLDNRSGDQYNLLYQNNLIGQEELRDRK